MNTTCSICLEYINQPKKLVCEHTFCNECIRTWLKLQKTCPCCRVYICKKNLRIYNKIKVENQKYLQHLYYERDVYEKFNNIDKLYVVYSKIHTCEEFQTLYGKHIRLRSLFDN